MDEKPVESQQFSVVIDLDTYPDGTSYANIRNHDISHKDGSQIRAMAGAIAALGLAVENGLELRQGIYPHSNYEVKINRCTPEDAYDAVSKATYVYYHTKTVWEDYEQVVYKMKTPCFARPDTEHYWSHKGVPAHRLVFAKMYPDDWPTEVVRHICGNKACVNPIHLYSGRIRDNNDDWDMQPPLEQAEALDKESDWERV